MSAVTSVKDFVSSFMLLENDGTDPITGIFSGLPEGAPVIFGTEIFNISYHGGTGNDVVLTLVSGGLPPLSIDKFTSSPVPGNPGANGLGSINQGAVEASNVNVVEELVAMIQAQRGYEINSKAIQTSDQMLQDRKSVV